LQKKHSKIDSFPIEVLSAEKAAETPHSVEEWAEVLQRGLEGLRGADVDLHSLSKIVRACTSPKQYARMVRLISQACRTQGKGRQVFELLDRHTSSTVFSLSEWILSLEYFAEWLDDKHYALDFLNMLNYIQCCTQLPDAKTPGANLLQTVKEAIDKFGVSWTTPRR
jgi:hypothetical protein